MRGNADLLSQINRLRTDDGCVSPIALLKRPTAQTSYATASSSTKPKVSVKSLIKRNEIVGNTPQQNPFEIVDLNAFAESVKEIAKPMLNVMHSNYTSSYIPNIKTNITSTEEKIRFLGDLSSKYSTTASLTESLEEASQNLECEIKERLKKLGEGKASETSKIKQGVSDYFRNKKSVLKTLSKAAKTTDSLPVEFFAKFTEEEKQKLAKDRTILENLEARSKIIAAKLRSLNGGVTDQNNVEELQRKIKELQTQFQNGGGSSSSSSSSQELERLRRDHEQALQEKQRHEQKAKELEETLKREKKAQEEKLQQQQVRLLTLISEAPKQATTSLCMGIFYTALGVVAFAASLYLIGTHGSAIVVGGIIAKKAYNAMISSKTSEIEHSRKTVSSDLGASK